MTTDPKPQEKKNNQKPGDAGKSVYAKKKAKSKKEAAKSKRESKEEFDQRIIDIARVTRVMAGGKRMRFRACVVIGDKKSKVGMGVAKGADVTMAITKAVNKAKKEMIEVPLVDNTIPHEIEHKYGAARVILKPARSGRGVIAGGVMRVILDMAGVQNVTCKNLGTNNKMNITRCTVSALSELKKVETPGKTKKENKAKPEAKTGEQAAKQGAKKPQQAGKTESKAKPKSNK